MQFLLIGRKHCRKLYHMFIDVMKSRGVFFFFLKKIKNKVGGQNSERLTILRLLLWSYNALRITGFGLQNNTCSVSGSKDLGRCISMLSFNGWSDFCNPELKAFWICLYSSPKYIFLGHVLY